MENSTRNSSGMAVKMLSRGARGPGGVGQTLAVNIPYIRSDIPILVLFRALGFVADKDILEHIVYNFEDTEMMEALRPSIEEAFPIQDQEVNLLCVSAGKLAVLSRPFYVEGKEWVSPGNRCIMRSCMPAGVLSSLSGFLAGRLFHVARDMHTSG